jgi:predicted nucleic acid-binding protein
LDAGPIGLNYQQDPPKEILSLFQSLKNKKISAFVSDVVLVEVFKNLCVASGKDHAANCIRSFQNNIPYQPVPLTSKLIIDAGQLKCQYRSKLSYNDCISIAIALDKNAEFHTTEKELPKSLRLRVIEYKF